MSRGNWYWRFLRGVLVAALLASAPTAALAQSVYPSRAITIVVPLPPGGIADTVPRILADKLSVRWGQPVVIENRPGAAQNIGAQAVARAESDGYTLLATPPGPLVINQYLHSKLGFDSDAFVPVSVLVSVPIVFVANPKVPFSTLQELVAFAKANPDAIKYGSPGAGSSLHLTAEMLRATAGIRFVHVPYKGMAPAMADLLAGHIDVTMDALGNAIPHIKDGALKALGIAGETRIAQLPDVPTISETYPGFISTTWFALVAPPGTPPEIATKVSHAIAETLALPEVAMRLRDLSVTPVGTSPTETAAFLKREAEHWGKVVASTGVKLD